MQPNFFIIGAPKCGTTALSEYLRMHPDIYMSEPKELFYFCDDFPAYRQATTEHEYLEKFFQDVTLQHQAVGEASALYLYSSVALQNLYRFNPNAKIIVMLRNPVDMVYSYHSQLLYDGDENEPDFEQAWKLQASRQKDGHISRLCREPRLLQYAEFGKLGQQIEHLLKIFPREQIHIIWFEEFASSTQLVYQKVLEFLEVPPDNRTEFERFNANKTHKSSLVGLVTQKTPKFLIDIAMKTKNIMGFSRWGVMDAIRSFNSEVTTRKPLSADFKAELMAEFATDIQKLSCLLDKDLSDWLT